MADKKEPPLITYTDVLRELEGVDSNHNHLLMGNGFNASLKIQTSYERIFNRMLKDEKEGKNAKGSHFYADIEGDMRECDYDIELYFSKVKNTIANDGSNERTRFVDAAKNKMTLDFMKALYAIVLGSFRKIYANEDTKNEIILFLNCFSRYFTLNYDPLFYLLTMRLLGESEKDAVADEEDEEDVLLDGGQEIPDELLEKVKKFIKNGEWKVGYAKNEIITPLSKAEKAEVKMNCAKYFTSGDEEQHNYSKSDIRKAAAIALEEVNARLLQEFDNAEKESNEQFEAEQEERREILTALFDDGFGNGDSGDNLNYRYERDRKKDLFDTDDDLGCDLAQRPMNVFYLHGAFHIVRHFNKNVSKMKRDEVNAFNEKVGDVVNKKGDTLICVLGGESKDKEIEIGKYVYLQDCHDSLDLIEGNLVILGCAMSENDGHVFSRLGNLKTKEDADSVPKPKIKTVYISTSEDKLKSTQQAAEKFFPDAEVKYFDYKTITYTPKK